MTPDYYGNVRSLEYQSPILHNFTILYTLNRVRTMEANKYVKNIIHEKLSIYEAIQIGDPGLWIPSDELEQILNHGMQGTSLEGLPLRTRSKVVKEKVCEILGYAVPRTFKKTQPRFIGQNFDTYIQKSLNLQIWNEEIAPNRRYVIIKVSEDDLITKVKVITGVELALLDTTGTLTQKYQALLQPSSQSAELIASMDTDILRSITRTTAMFDSYQNPDSYPETGKLLSISEVYKRLETLIGEEFVDSGSDQERNRGGELHRIVCRKLGYVSYKDNGQFPDIRHQLLEVKLQTSPTIDLGTIKPDSEEPLDIPMINGYQIRPCDVRYALFYAVIANEKVRLTNFYLTTGEMFFSRFPQMKGKEVNKKLQIPLPRDFFDN